MHGCCLCIENGYINNNKSTVIINMRGCILLSLLFNIIVLSARFLSGERHNECFMRYACMYMHAGIHNLWYAACISILLLCLDFSVEESADYWVRPADKQECPSPLQKTKCISLSDIVTRTGDYFNTSQSTVHFLPGIHSPEPNASGWIIVGPNVNDISIIGEVYNNCNPHTKCGVVIECDSSKIGFLFSSLHRLRLTNIEIRNCGFRNSDIPQSVIPLRYTNFFQANTAILVFNLQQFFMKGIQITNTSGFGLLLITSENTELEPQCHIEDSKIAFSNWKHDQYILQNTTHPGGSIFIIIPEMSQLTAYVTVSNCVLVNGVGSGSLIPWNKGLPQSLYTSGGLTVWSFSKSNVYIFLENSSFNDNIAHRGASVYLPQLLLKDGFSIVDRFVKLNINKCKFQNNRAISDGGAVYLDYLYIPERSEKAEEGILLSVRESDFKHNEARKQGGGIYLNIGTVLVYTKELDKKIYYNFKNCLFITNMAHTGAGIYASISANHLGTNPSLIAVLFIGIHIQEVHFRSHLAIGKGGAVYISVNVDPGTQIEVNKTKCTFSNNSADTGSALSIQFSNWHISQYIMFLINLCLFSQNYSPSKGAQDTVGGSVISLHTTKYLILENTNITINYCRAVYSLMSTIQIKGEVIIANNTAVATNGAGIFMDYYPTSSKHEESQILLQNHSTLYILRNKASGYGGGVGIKGGGETEKQCFFGLITPLPNLMKLTSPLIVMQNNTAGIAGESIYGGNLETCTIKLRNNQFITKEQLTLDYFWSFFDIEENNHPSAVASQSYKVCVCNTNFTSERKCRSAYQVTSFPGQIFQVPVVGVGQYEYSSPSVIRLNSLDDYAFTSVDDIWITQAIGILCKNLSYSIHTQLHSEVISMYLSIENPEMEYISLPPAQVSRVDVYVRQCPHGFKLDSTSRICNCTDCLIKAGVTCNIDSQTIHKNPLMWIGNHSGEIVVHNNCPFDYCKQDIVDINPYNEQEQCNYQRSDILCGACRPGLSLMLGTSQCGKCSNNYLLLLIPFALAGVALVVLLLKCNLTVSSGTINGLIFYVNIVQANYTSLFPQGNGKIIVNIFSVFISWLNLDFGIEICFAENLNMFYKTWLQFLFPVYIWVLVGLLILVSKHSITVSKFTGSNTVSVLATLFLLSYAKILRTTFNAFSSTTLTNCNNTPTSLWLLDGNYKFLHWPHVLLFLSALLMLVAHVLPFTFLILLSPQLQAYSHLKLLKWVTKFTPLIDAFHGQYKTKYRYWTGLMLFLRLVLFSIYTGNVLGNPRLNLLVTILALACLLLIWVKVGRVYKNKLLNGLELFYHMNLLLFTACALYLRSGVVTSTLSQDILVYIMVGSVLIAVMCTLVYHCYIEFKQSRLGKSIIRKSKDFLKNCTKDQTNEIVDQLDNTEIQDDDDDDGTPMKSTGAPTVTIVDIRELLLQDES